MSNFRLTVYFLFTAAVWGASFLFLRIGVPEFGPYAFACLRALIAACVLLPFVLNRTHWQEIKTHWLALSALGILNMGIPFTLFSYAAQSTQASVLSVINASVPLLTGAIAHLFFRDLLNRRQILGLLIGVIGVTLLVWDSHQATNDSFLAMLAAFVACLCYAISANLTKRYFTEIRPMSLAAVGILASGLLILPLMLTHLPEQSISLKAWGAVIAIAVFSTAMAMILFYQILKTIGPTKTVSLTLLIPMFGMLWGVTLLDEHLSVAMIVGAAIILLGTALAVFSKK